MKTLIIVLFIIVVILFLLAMGKPVNEWCDKHIFNKDINNFNKDINNPKVKEKVNEIESNLKLKYPNLKEKGE